ncbi:MULTISPECIES: hypothetical protein [unclassified Bradyrhizobium]|uniref:hypothetical protein n=1 Tax=unclassified Bradyrhizobium TaxID=2631580 RepID=UPI0028EA64DD|nr:MULTISPECIES: hypothetical protein [unclassified Bradyrhizobium]
MTHEFKESPDQPGAALKSICVAQAIISISTLTSTAVLLAKLVPTMITGLP